MIFPTVTHIVTCSHRPAELRLEAERILSGQRP